MKQFVFIIPPAVELLDLAGPMQVFEEAKFYGFDLNLECYALYPEPVSALGLPFGKIAFYQEAKLNSGDFIFIPGVQFEELGKLLENEIRFFEWLKECYSLGVNICSVCNAAFFLGKAGLLDQRECTTHWRRVEFMQMLFPKAIVLNDVLFVKSDTVYTSAGISAGIDLALAVLEELTDPLFVNKVARGLVVYHRRSHRHTQNNIYLDYRNHINPKVHQIQDFLIENLSAEVSLEKLALHVNSSMRNLSRIFKEATEITIIEFVTKLRLEKAKTLKSNPEYTMEYIAAQCGFKTARQLQRILKSDQENEN